MFTSMLAAIKVVGSERLLLRFCRKRLLLAAIKGDGSERSLLAALCSEGSLLDVIKWLPVFPLTKVCNTISYRSVCYVRTVPIEDCEDYNAAVCVLQYTAAVVGVLQYTAAVVVQTAAAVGVLQYIATVGVALYRDREREGRKRVYSSGAGRKSHVVTTVVSAGVPASSAQIHTPPGSLALHSLVHCRGMHHAPLGSPLVLLLLIEPPVSPLSDEGPFPPPLPLVPPCLNPAFHDRNNAIVAWYNPGARPKRPAPGLGRAPRQRLFEVCHLEIKRGARTSRRLA
ncbi:hypothetical protein BHM03_00037311 [Ensete ventricosum]|nr:hypothetical protein BHM03_00037311 [Ensete ventricosum]